VAAKAASSLLRLGPSAFGDPKPLSEGRRHAPATPASNPLGQAKNGASAALRKAHGGIRVGEIGAA